MARAPRIGRLHRMKKRMLITALVLGAITLATIRWTFDGLAWATRPARPSPA